MASTQVCATQMVDKKREYTFRCDLYPSEPSR